MGILALEFTAGKNPRYYTSRLPSTCYLEGRGFMPQKRSPLLCIRKSSSYRGIMSFLSLEIQKSQCQKFSTMITWSWQDSSLSKCRSLSWQNQSKNLYPCLILVKCLCQGNGSDQCATSPDQDSAGEGRIEGGSLFFLSRPLSLSSSPILYYSICLVSLCHAHHTKTPYG